MTAIVAELDTLAPSDPATGAAVARVRADLARLADVIDAILVLSDRAHELPGTVVNLADVAREVAYGGVRVEAPDEALVEGDERLVRLAVRNLLDNAGKYGGERVCCASRATTWARRSRSSTAARGWTPQRAVGCSIATGASRPTGTAVGSALRWCEPSPNATEEAWKRCQDPTERGSRWP